MRCPTLRRHQKHCVVAHLLPWWRRHPRWRRLHRRLPLLLSDCPPLRHQPPPHSVCGPCQWRLRREAAAVSLLPQPLKMRWAAYPQLGRLPGSPCCGGRRCRPPPLACRSLRRRQRAPWVRRLRCLRRRRRRPHRAGRWAGPHRHHCPEGLPPLHRRLRPTPLRGCIRRLFLGDHLCRLRPFRRAELASSHRLTLRTWPSHPHHTTL